MNRNFASYDYEESEDVMDLDDFVPAEERTDEIGLEDSMADDMQPLTMNDSSDSDQPVEEYKLKSITNAFLRCETRIKVESSKTVIKFEYRGEFYRGIVLQQFNNHKDDYIFLVQSADKNGKVKSSTPKVMKKIHIPDVNLIG